MYVIPIKQPEIIDSNIAEIDPYPKWSSADTYAVEDRIYVDTDSDGGSLTPHEVYESLIDSNNNIHPRSDSSAWAKVGPTNRWAMFDYYISTKTENTDYIYKKLPAGRCDTVALFGLEATEVNIVVKYAETVILDETFSLIGDDSVSWTDYFFNEKEYESVLLVTIPLYNLGSTVEITISRPGGIARCGHCCLGRKCYIGNTLYGPRIGINDYSKKDTNEFGITYLKQGTYVNKIDLSVSIKTAKVDFVKKTLTNLRGTPAVWQANNIFSNGQTDFESLLEYGFFTDFEIVLAGYNISDCNIEIEGLA